MNKKYWLKGLITGIIIYALCVLGAYFFIVYSAPKGNYFGEALALIVGFVIYYLSPAIPLGLLIGWMYGKVPKIAVFLSIIVFVSMVCIEVLIIKNAFFPPPFNPQASVDKMMQGKHQIPCPGQLQNSFTKCWEPN